MTKQRSVVKVMANPIISLDDALHKHLPRSLFNSRKQTVTNSLLIDGKYPPSRVLEGINANIHKLHKPQLSASFAAKFSRGTNV